MVEHEEQTSDSQCTDSTVTASRICETRASDQHPAEGVGSWTGTSEPEGPRPLQGKVLKKRWLWSVVGGVNGPYADSTSLRSNRRAEISVGLGFIRIPE